MICERDTKSHARHITLSVPAHTQRLTKDSHNTGNPAFFEQCAGLDRALDRWRIHVSDDLKTNMSLKKSDEEYREKAADVARLERSWPVVCINMGSISACLCLYIWKLLAPVFRSMFEGDTESTAIQSHGVRGRTNYE